MSAAGQIIHRLGVLGVCALVCGYRVMLAPLLVGQCNFLPTCSEYMIQAVRAWGVPRGVWLGLKRLARCHPLGPGGLDPVPQCPRRLNASADHRKNL